MLDFAVQNTEILEEMNIKTKRGATSIA